MTKDSLALNLKSHTEGLVAERNSWFQKFKEGYKPFLVGLYKQERDSNLWRSSRLVEELCEYVLYLEGQVDAQ